MAIVALLLVTQPAQSASKSKEAKMIEYQRCLEARQSQWDAANQIKFLDAHINACAKYRP